MVWKYVLSGNEKTTVKNTRTVNKANLDCTHTLAPTQENLGESVSHVPFRL